MSFFNERLGDLFESGSNLDDSNPSSIYGRDQINRFGNWYEGPGGESATKIGLALIAMFGPGAALMGGMGGGEAAGGGGGSSTGGAIPMFGNSAKGLLGSFLGGAGGGGGGTTSQRRRGVLREPVQATPVFSFGDDMIAPETQAMFRQSTLV